MAKLQVHITPAQYVHVYYHTFAVLIRAYHTQARIIFAILHLTKTVLRLANVAHPTMVTANFLYL
jgi:hypothetical protein